MKAIEKEKAKAEKEIKKAERDTAKVASEKERVGKARDQVKKKIVQRGSCVGKSKVPTQHDPRSAAIRNDLAGWQSTPDCPTQPCPGNAPVARMW